MGAIFMACEKYDGHIFMGDITCGVLFVLMLGVDL